MSGLGKVWDEAIGAYEWLKSLTLGEFAEDRPTSVIVTDMLVAMTVPGAVIVTSARDLAAVCLRLGHRYAGTSTAQQNAAHPEWEEWVRRFRTTSRRDDGARIARGLSARRIGTSVSVTASRDECA